VPDSWYWSNENATYVPPATTPELRGKGTNISGRASDGLVELTRNFFKGNLTFITRLLSLKMPKDHPITSLRSVIFHPTYIHSSWTGKWLSLPQHHSFDMQTWMLKAALCQSRTKQTCETLLSDHIHQLCIEARILQL